MANVERLSISLSEELAEMVRGAVEGGGYTSSSEVIREALRDWKVKQVVQDAELVRLREAVQAGVADMENGRYTTIANDEDAAVFLEGIKTRGREKLAEIGTK